jgi:hypothetical protein
MFEKFLLLPPLARRAVIAAVLFGVMLVDLLLPKCDFTVFLFFVLTFGWLWAIGILRPLLFFLLFLVRGVLRTKYRPWWY